MKNLFSLVFFLSLIISAIAQNTSPQPTPPPDEEGDVVKITTTLIQVDAVVTGKDGKPVRDLTAADFEIYENNVKQEITNFSFISVSPEKTETNEKPAKNSANAATAPPVPSGRMRPEQIRRTIALVVDDLGLSFESTAHVRQALKKFVDEQVQPGDLVAIIRTGGGVGALQSFTSDKRQLYAAIEKVRWNPTGRAGVGAFAPIEAPPGEQIANQTGSEEEAERAREQRQSAQDFDNFRTDFFAVGTLGALNFIVKGMSELPGRKSIVLMSDGFRIFNRDVDGNPDASQRILQSLRRLTDLANRAAVVINTVDARGLQTLGLTAADNVGGLSAEQLEQRLSDRRNELFDTQEGLNYLAQQTGGRAFRNSNDIKSAIEKSLDDQNGYYLLGYQPDDATFDPARLRFNKLTVKVKRPGLNVRHRSGFLSIADKDEELRPTTLTPQQQIFSALTSPFGASGIGLRLNTIFGNEAAAGSFIRSLVHVNAKDLKFMDEPNGVKKAVFDIVAYTFGDNGVPVDSVAKNYTMTVNSGERFQRLQEKGFVYYINVPIKKPGAYQLRVALRDAQSEKVGAANQFVEAPNLKKNRLTLSGIVLQNLTPAQYEKWSKAQSVSNTTGAQNAEDAPDTQTDTALRRFRRGTILWFGFVIYNAKSESGKTPQLTTQTRVYRDGKLFFEGSAKPVSIAGQKDLQRINAQNAISLPTEMPPGDYVLQIAVTDAFAKEKYQTTTQWIDFEVVN
ncbi:MAG: VWA domain-containing protein [Acidobacteriota bacterium]|nr:VWA domain-containing protein [Acidobacteriota bacterium]